MMDCNEASKSTGSKGDEVKIKDILQVVTALVDSCNGRSQLMNGSQLNSHYFCIEASQARPQQRHESVDRAVQLQGNMSMQERVFNEAIQRLNCSKVALAEWAHAEHDVANRQVTLHGHDQDRLRAATLDAIIHRIENHGGITASWLQTELDFAKLYRCNTQAVLCLCAADMHSHADPESGRRLRTAVDEASESG